MVSWICIRDPTQANEFFFTSLIESRHLFSFVFVIVLFLPPFLFLVARYDTRLTIQ